MSNDEFLTDDYVARLLAQDAKDCSLKYSAMGMEAFRNNQKPSNMPKPNTRFLRNIIKDTDTHNKALLAKEAAESRARLQDLEHAEDVKRRKSNPNAKDIRRRQIGDIHAILGGKDRRRANDDDPRRSTRHKRDARGDVHGKQDEKKSDDLIDERGDGKRKRGRLSERDYFDHDAEARSDNVSVQEGIEGQGRQGEKDPLAHPTVENAVIGDARIIGQGQGQGQDQDSDPLEDLIGPAPPPKFRGRGTIGGAVELDRRFSESYDPALDVLMSEDGEFTRDDAGESFRDLQKLQLHRDQRLKDAGFTDEDIQRAKGTADKTGEDVVWSRAGEKREWDKGKSPGLDGVDEDDTHPPTLFSVDY
ncbi:pre-mRNA-splicing factor 38B [Metarhizium rileyi]|uniref:Pre-mRNA-splicing factor 38B n=1 Tax=Metarhizium rileyi (strain RCEF 4871) TaxID=1649241 RepID=A0A167I2G8_METRR|nr:pre-mRNA-splicing factor 38B [Metarhizium rileyi RCEF 4871]